MIGVHGELRSKEVIPVHHENEMLNFLVTLQEK
jgi:hypothetical protein